MKHLLLTSMILGVCSVTLAQQPSGCQGKEPREVVEKYWRAATRGEFLSKDGWVKQAGFFSGSPSPNSGAIYVMSDDWEVGPVTQTGNRAQVIVDVEPEGQIDSSLHYTPPPRTDAVKQGTLNRLTCVPTRYTDFKVESNELKPNKTVEGPSAWQLEGSPKDTLATVNAAIRHVLEIQRTTKDPVIRKNADETLSQLLRLH